MRRLLTFLLPLFGLAVFVAIVARTGPERIGVILAGVDPAELLLTPLLIMAIALVRGARWRYVMQSLGFDYGLARSTVVWAIGFFASSVTPAKAGDAMRALYVRNDTGRPLGEALVSVFIDRLWDLGFVLSAGVVSVFIFSREYTEIPSAWWFIATALLIVVVVAVVSRRNWMQAILRPAFMLLIPARHRALFSGGFHSFYDALRAYGSAPRRSLVLAAYTLVGWGLIFILAVYVARLLSLPVSARYIVLMMPILTLVELLPLSISGLGTREATAIYFFSVVNVGSAEAVGFSIVYVLIGTYLTALCGFVLWLRHPVRWNREEPA